MTVPGVEGVEDMVVEEDTATEEDVVEMSACEATCESTCNTDADAACLHAEEYSPCILECGDTIRQAGCKAACATLNQIECGIIFRNECMDDCKLSCN
jgi:hypothetical protein